MRSAAVGMTRTRLEVGSEVAVPRVFEFPASRPVVLGVPAIFAAGRAKKHYALLVAALPDEPAVPRTESTTGRESFLDRRLGSVVHREVELALWQLASATA